jgi:hypothetical protein
MTDPRFQVVTFPRWAELRRRVPRLLLGIVILGAGIAMTIEPALGVSPYDVLHQGIARQTGLSFGTVVILVGLAILLLWVPIRQPPGVGTVVNALTVGLVIDVTFISCRTAAPSPPAGRCSSAASWWRRSVWASTSVPASARARGTGS